MPCVKFTAGRDSVRHAKQWTSKVGEKVDGTQHESIVGHWEQTHARGWQHSQQLLEWAGWLALCTVDYGKGKMAQTSVKVGWKNRWKGQRSGVRVRLSANW